MRSRFYQHSKAARGGPGKPGLRGLSRIVLVLAALTCITRAALADSFVTYVDQFFEVRDQQVPTKYVFNGETRVAQSVAPLSSRSIIQRLEVTAGWNLRSTAVTVSNVLEQFSAGHPTPPVNATYRWNPSSKAFVVMNNNDLLPAGTVIWIHCVTNTTLSISGAYSQPADLILLAGGAFIPSAGLEFWDLTNQLPATASLWKRVENQWETRLSTPLGSTDLIQQHIAPGEAAFLDLSEPLTLRAPDPGWRLLYYHEDHLGSAACISDAEGQPVTETAYYAFGGERQVSSTRKGRIDFGFTGKERDAEHGLLNFDSRLLWPGGARFIRVDSLADKFKENTLHSPQNLNPYSYCLNNPLAVVDPDGREARVINHGNGKITIQVAIQYVGPLATKANIARANKGIEKYWTGKFGRYNVTMKVLDPGQDPTLKPAVVTLTGKDEKGKYLRSFVKVAEDTGQWNPKDSDFSWVAAHETGHLLGLDDRYADKKGGGSVADAGWRGNMMATSGARVEQRNVDELLLTSGFMVLRAPKTDPNAQVRHNRQVVDSTPESRAAANQRDMAIQMKAWELSDK